MCEKERGGGLGKEEVGRERVQLLFPSTVAIPVFSSLIPGGRTRSSYRPCISFWKLAFQAGLGLPNYREV